MDIFFEILSRIDWDKANSIISGLSMIILAFTVLEMRNQRINSYKPDIYFDSKQYKLFEGEWLGFRLKPNARNNYGGPDIVFRNVGNGIAKDIKITMFYDIIRMKRDIIKECNDFYSKSEYDINDARYSLRSLYTRDLKQKPTIIIQYLKDQSIISNFAMCFTAYYNVMAENLNKKKEFSNKKLLNVPIEIEYRDISSKRRKAYKKAVATLEYTKFLIPKNNVLTPDFDIKLTIECFTSTKIYYIRRQIINHLLGIYYLTFGRGHLNI